MPDSFVNRLIQFVQESNPDLWEYAIRQVEEQINREMTINSVFFVIMLASLVGCLYLFTKTKDGFSPSTFFADDQDIVVVMIIFLGVLCVMSGLVSYAAFASAEMSANEMDVQALYWLLSELK